ncbi:ACP S-malonyltransferase [Streptomyces spiramenti]|uniref:ACP S-malonyltransferase n=1 Tax=Streptomyces spiramenti TaxID=2720606 RepID=A0ABX1AKE8_9ACTN|nr:ACP S-malonyltransferase [Streptomyces spiramenti]NJP64730.1 ACP S-malonyltransferase [Streptomyces spiramenti]
MSLGYLFGGGVGAEPHGIELYEASPLVRQLYEEISGWTGLTAEQILRGELPEGRERRQSAGTIREAALAMAVHDRLAEAGLRPDVVGGLSLGAMTASCLAGALDRRSLFTMLARTAGAPGPRPSAAGEGMALAFVQAEDARSSPPWQGLPDVHLAGDFGPVADGSRRILMLAGHRTVIERLAAESAPGTIVPLPGRDIAVHSPLRKPFRDFIAPHVARMPFTAPRIPLLSCLERGELKTADEVREMFERNPTDPISLVDIYEGMRSHDVRLGLVMGPAIPEGILAFPFPVVHVENPDHIELAISTAYDLGIPFSRNDSGTGER